MLFGIFIVFFNLAKYKVVSAKVAPCIKVPYVKGRVDIYKTNLNHYNNIHNIIYYAEKGSNRTYFYFKNNSFKYYNAIRKPLFVIDVVNEKYKMIELNNASYTNNDPQSLIIVTEQGKQYLVSNEMEYEDKGNYLAVIDITNNEEIYMEKRDEKNYLYFSFIRPIGNSIIPIIRITGKYVGVDLVDLSSNQRHHVSWFLTEIQEALLEELIENSFEEEFPEELIEMIEILKKELMKRISHIKVEEIRYKYANYGNDTRYVEKASFTFMLKTYAGDYEYEFNNVSLNVVLNPNKRYLIVYLDFSETNVTIDGTYYGELSGFISKKKLLSKKITFSGNVYKNSMSDILYSNSCYVIWHAINGISIARITQSEEDYSDKPKVSALYRYKHYLFIFRRRGTKDLIIVNTKSNSIAVWTSIHNYIYVNPKLIYNFYYLSKDNVFLFIYTDIYYVLLVDKEILDRILDQDNKCHEIANDVIKSFDLNSAISNFIYSYYHGRSIEIDNFVGHYVNEELGLLYIVTSYKVDQVKHIGLLECKIIGSNINLKLLDFVSANKIYSSKYRKAVKVGNIQLYKIREKSPLDSELCYGSNDKIISIGYNRQSVSLRSFLEKQPRDYVIKRRNILQYEKLIILEHAIREESKLDYIIWFSFIVSELCLVDKWEE